MIRRRAVLATLTVATCWQLGAAPAAGQTPEPYRDPPFTCVVIDYGTAPPTLPAPPDDPLCVRYDKSNITVSTLGVVDFLAAEPGRVAVVAGKCGYWQQDRWSIRVTPDTPALVSWDGSYWYDAATGVAGGTLRNLEVAGQPADADTFIDALRPLIGDEQADAFREYADEGGGGGATFALDESATAALAAAGCDRAAPGSPPPPSPGSTGAPEPPPGPATGDRAGSTRPHSEANLPASGGHPSEVTGLLLLVAAAVARACLVRAG